MDKTKQNKVARMIQKELGDIFQREGFANTGKSLLTVTEVRITPDLSISLVFLSLYGGKDPKKIFEEISKQNREIRKKLGEKIRFKVRIIPELKFILDDSLDYAEKIDKLLKDAKK
ncbi:MAG TPA: 30S ribosome-binding factor RbfA [Bacteroidia bacterium]|nr:30S ribosome-binding factor RbfA [Bacteroidia bacterium]